MGPALVTIVPPLPCRDNAAAWWQSPGLETEPLSRARDLLHLFVLAGWAGSWREGFEMVAEERRRSYASALRQKAWRVLGQPKTLTGTGFGSTCMIKNPWQPVLCKPLVEIVLAVSSSLSRFRLIWQSFCDGGVGKILPARSPTIVMENGAGICIAKAFRRDLGTLSPRMCRTLGPIVFGISMVKKVLGSHPPVKGLLRRFPLHECW